MNEKWDAIVATLKRDTVLFAELESKPNSVKQQFKRITEAAMKACGITDQTVNLSGLSNQPSELQLLLFNMRMEVDNAKQIKQKEKKGRKEKKTDAWP